MRNQLHRSDTEGVTLAPRLPAGPRRTGAPRPPVTPVPGRDDAPGAASRGGSAGNTVVSRAEIALM
ncbi:MAG: hypothetical protein LC776_15810 [Acidobacteria bacterium]|nr:hypothetical protein [Acidobacteriota bacterium]